MVDVFRHTAADDIQTLLGVLFGAAQQNQNKFIAAQPGQDIGIPDLLLHIGSKPPQIGVTGGMAQGVIDFLETVEVQIHQGKGGMVAFQLAQCLHRKSPGPGAGEIVEVGIAAQIVQPLVGLHQGSRQTVIAVFHMEFPQNFRQADKIAADIH